MGLNVKVCFFGDWFGCWVYGFSRFGCFFGDSDLVLGDWFCRRSGFESCSCNCNRHLTGFETFCSRSIFLCL